MSREEGLGASVDCQASLSSTFDASIDLNSMSGTTFAEEAEAAIAEAPPAKETAVAVAVAEEARLKAQANIAEASAAKETAEAVSSALADIDSLLASLLSARNRRQEGITAALKATSKDDGISAPTSCAGFADMVDQVTTLSFF